LSPEKGLEYLIEAAGILHERDASFELLLVGKGPQEIQIKNLIKALDRCQGDNDKRNASQ
jgi:glycosyltransferase involved in cell wall biosynthesis